MRCLAAGRKQVSGEVARRGRGALERAQRAELKSRPGGLLKMTVLTLGLGLWLWYLGLR